MQKSVILLIVVLMGAIGFWFYRGGSFYGLIEDEAKELETEINYKVANDAVRQYQIAKRNGTMIDRCVHAGFVAAAYLQAQDEAQYITWKQIQKHECAAAGVPIEPTEKPYVSTWNPKPKPAAAEESKKPYKWQDSKGYWHFSDEDPALEEAHTVSGTGIYKWQDDQGNWHYSDKGIED